MENELPVVKISVRNLVEFILREGDIDNRAGTGMNLDAMQLGGKIHRKIQRRMGADYQAEVSLKCQIEMDGFCLNIEGRADGILKEADGFTVDEIKGILSNIEHLTEPVPVHLAQAKCYAYIFASQHACGRMGVQMTYCQMETEEIKRFRQEYAYEELEEWFLNLTGRYERWAKFQLEWKNIRNASVKRIEFPFVYRKGQRELAVSVYKTILRKKKLFIQAPTGVGKTISTIFPAIKAVGEGLGEKIFYLTAKTITRTVAEQAFDKLREQRLRYKVITLTAKEKLCFCEKMDCNPENCSYAKGHYDRVNDAIYELLISEDEMSREKIEKQARKHEVCPFELALDLSLWVDAVICDYNYVFDPNVHLKRFFSEGNAGDYLFLIDEAHNLVERGRSMYSAELYKEEFLELKKLVKKEDGKLAKRLEECNKMLLALKKECDHYLILDNISHMYFKLLNTWNELEQYLENCKQPEVREAALELYFRIRHFLNIYDGMDENYVVYAEYLENGRFMLRLFCVNPAGKLHAYLSMGNSAIFFSATLLPIQYYKELLSVEKDDYAIYIDSPFETKNRLLMSGMDVSAKYTCRTDAMYQRYAEYIYRAVKVKKGNYLAFFPSYKFMEQVYDKMMEQLEQSGDEIECIIQSHFMNEEAREIFLENFEDERMESLVGFCVLGGIFSEGIDLAEERLIGAFIVGTGLPQVCNEREILKQYFEKKGHRGFDYAYLYPGMNKVLQAAGRVIRTEEDQGIILLLDDRFREKRCRESFPKEWKDCAYCRLENVEASVRNFWDKRKSTP